MKILVTAGNTLVPIDRVRCITNVFTGRTGAQIALHGHERGHNVTLLTSQPEVVDKILEGKSPPREHWSVQTYRTFDDLGDAFRRQVQSGRFEVIIHSAAVSDYQTAGVYAPAPDAHFHPDGARWESQNDQSPALVDRTAGKVKSDSPELWLRLVRTPKLIDSVRTDWAFRGILVKFKLEVDIGEAELLAIAERSRRQSGADLMAANTLEGAKDWALLGPVGGRYQRIPRTELAPRLLDAVEQLEKEPSRG
jgi:phosphopantothenoylcysteine synthetase/decarboxylase